jgi:hypothetical protein
LDAGFDDVVKAQLGYVLATYVVILVCIDPVEGTQCGSGGEDDSVKNRELQGGRGLGQAGVQESPGLGLWSCRQDRRHI